MTRASRRREGLEGQRIRLSPIRPKDSAKLFRWINDRELVVFNAGFHPVHASQHASWMRSVAGRPDLVVFAIRKRRGDALIGVCQLHTISAVHRSAELQIRIGDAASRGRGFGLEAVRLLVEFAFRDLNLHRVWLQVFRTNVRALKTYAAAGFAREGVMRQAAFIDGKYVDVVVMGIVNRA
jgi:RimJ/RimL family protein N-acetyltransferase